MAYSWQESVKPAGTQDIQCDIEYLDKSYIHVYLDGAETTAFTWTSSTNIHLNSALSAETVVLLIRKTEREYLYIEFAGGAPFIEGNVDTQNTQFLHLAQELVEGRSIEGFYGDINMHRYRITNLGDPVDAMDAANKQYVDAGDARLYQRIDAERTVWKAAVANEASIRKAADDALGVRTTNLEQTHFNANTNSFPWWTVLTVATDTVTPGMPFSKAKVRLNGVTQTAGYSYTINSGVVKFAEVLPAGTLVDMTIGVDTDADTGVVASVLALLASSSGATYVSTASGDTVQTALTKLEGAAKRVGTYAELQTTTPEYAGQVVMLVQHTHTGVGGGLFVARTGTVVDDGGVLCRVSSTQYWERLLTGSVDVSMFGCDPTGTIDSYTQLMSALNYSASTGTLLTQSGLTYVTQSIIAPTGINIDFSGFVVMTDASGLEGTYGGYMWVQGVYRGSTTDAYTTIRNLRLSTSLTDAMRGAPRTAPFNGAGLVVLEYITAGYIYTAGFQYGGVRIEAEKGAIRADMVECYLRARPNNSDVYTKAYGYYNAGADTKIDKLKVIKYARGAWTGDFSYYGSIHCWGLPALASSDPNAAGYQWGTMLAGLFVGTSTYVGYYYCDTPETTSYDTPATYDDVNNVYLGYGVVFVGYESTLDNYMFLLYKAQQKQGKVRIAHYMEGRNQHTITYLTCHDGALFDKTNTITYANRNVDFFKNYISGVSGDYLHQYVDTWSADAAFHVSFTGITAHTGTIKYVRRGTELGVYININATAVDTAASTFSMMFVRVPTQVATQSLTMPLHNITTWGCVRRPSGAVDTLSVINGGSPVGTVAVPRNLSGLAIANVVSGVITFKHIDIADGTAWHVAPSQLRTGSLIMSVQFQL